MSSLRAIKLFRGGARKTARKIASEIDTLGGHSGFRHKKLGDKIDLDENGKPDTLRLLFASPKRWIAGGQIIRVESNPTNFDPAA